MTFSEHEKLVDHVSTCPYLDQGLYWCPTHQQSERFAEALTDGTAGMTSRRHSWKGAVKAIRKLGSKGLQKAIHPSRSKRAQDHKWVGKSVEKDVSRAVGIQELMTEARLFELDNQASFSLSASSGVVHEMVGAYLPLELEDTCDYAIELDSEILSCPSMDWETAGDATPESSPSPISPLSPAERWNQQFSKDLDSPISPTDSVQLAPWALDLTYTIEGESRMAAQEADSVSFAVDEVKSKDTIENSKTIQIDTTFANTTAFMWPGTWSTPPLSLSDYVASDDEDFMNTSMLHPTAPENNAPGLPETAVPLVQGPARHIEDLRDVFHVIFELTVQKLSCTPRSYNAIALINSDLLTEGSALDNAFSALRKILRGEYELTFWEVFGYAHVAYASAMLANAVDLVAETRRIFSEILNLSGNITNHDDRSALLQLAHELWSPNTSADVHESLPSIAENSSMKQWPWTQSCPAVMPSTLHEQAISLDDTDGSDGTLQNGPPRDSGGKRLCIQVLEAIEYADMQYHNSTSPETQPDVRQSSLLTSKDATRGRIMREYVIEPLITNVGLEGFMPVVLEADKLLKGVRQISLRELELKLLHDGKQCARSQTLYQKFVETVTKLVDHVSLLMSGELATREQYYVQDIDRVLLLYHGLQHESRFPIQDLESAGHTIDAMFAEPETFAPSNAANNVGDQMNSAPIASLPPTTQSSPSINPADGSLTCKQCGKVFRGKLIWLQSNLQRHVREKHSSAKKLMCTHERCGKTFIRKHNLKVHVETVHNRTRGL
ncbi:hypothetical protein MMC13_007499 [Lambiella insularis]|nr:hypothetical protein [Lambiella insularis]